MKNILFSLKTLSPLHCGIGQGLSDIDLPTARNTVSGHPIVPGSSLKGVMKDEFSNGTIVPKDQAQKTEYIEALFGKDGNEFASAISVGDANLLALPVRSYFGTFAYLASPYTLQLLKKLLERSGKSYLPAIPSLGMSGDQNPNYKALIPPNSLIQYPQRNSILLEELDLLIDSKQTELADKWADVIAPLFFQDEEGQKIFKQRFVIADDNALNFLCETALPVDARIAIDQETGTVKTGALWYEETVPMESLFVGMIGVDKSYKEKFKKTAEELSGFLIRNHLQFQIGGKSTTGKGFVEIHFNQEGGTHAN
ncbi:type III-B CRISPR module RAMP protein Cmr4 [Deltaproteobacteria bacterium TL4]